MKNHIYHSHIQWKGEATKGYTSYSRDFTIDIEGKTQEILGSADPSFRGDTSRYNPENLFLSSISSCHMLWYLHLCAVNNVVVVAYEDRASGTMEETEKGSGHFTSVKLSPYVIVQSASMKQKSLELHQKANEMCFIANSCNFPIIHEAITVISK